MKTTYYLGSDKKVYTAHDIAKAALIINDEELTSENDVDKYVNDCKGISHKLTDITVEELVSRGEHVKAVILYREINDCTLIVAEETIKKMEINLKKKLIHKEK